MAKKSLMVGLLMATAATIPAQAQTMDTDSSAWSQAVNQTQVIVPGGGGGGTHRQEVDYSGGYSVKSVPDVVAPMIPGGTNPCVVGMSAGGSVVGFGMSAGGSWNDIDCERRNLSIILMNAASKFDDPSLVVAGLEVLCNNREVADAMALAGRPCLSGRPNPQQAHQPDRQEPRSQTAALGTSDYDWIDDPTIGR